MRGAQRIGSGGHDGAAAARDQSGHGRATGASGADQYVLERSHPVRVGRSEQVALAASAEPGGDRHPLEPAGLGPGPFGDALRLTGLLEVPADRPHRRVVAAHQLVRRSRRSLPVSADEDEGGAVGGERGRGGQADPGGAAEDQEPRAADAEVHRRFRAGNRQGGLRDRARLLVVGLAGRNGGRWRRRTRWRAVP
jgi:hypothetical protein